MSIFDFSDVSEERGPPNASSSAPNQGFNFFERNVVPGLESSELPRKPSDPVASSYSSSFSSIPESSGQAEGSNSSNNRKVESGPQAQLDLQGMRARREGQIIASRKAKRSSRMNSQRRISTKGASTSAAAVAAVEEGSMEITEAGAVEGDAEGTNAEGRAAAVCGAAKHQMILEDALKLNCALVNDNSSIHSQREGMEWFTKTLSTERSSRPPVDAVVACGIVPRMISFLALGCDSLVQTRACAAISHLACADGDYVGTYLVEHGVITPLVTLLMSAKAASKERLREICLSCVGNLSAYTKECRDLLFNSGIMEPLLGQLGMQVQMAQGSEPSTSRVAVVKQGVSPSLATMTYLSWSLDNLSKGEPPPPSHITMHMILPLSCLLQSPDEKVVLTTLNTLLTLCESSRRNENVQLLLEAGVFKRLYELLCALPGGAGFKGNGNGNGNGGGEGEEEGVSGLSVPSNSPTNHFSSSSSSSSSSPLRTFNGNSSPTLSQLTAINTRELGLRVFAAGIRCSTSLLHRKALVSPYRFPLLIPMIVRELSRTASIKPTLGVWGAVRAKGNVFYQGRQSEVYKKVGGGYNFDFAHLAAENGLTPEEAQTMALDEEQRRLEAEYDIKLELVACINTLVQLDTPRDRKYTYRFLDLGIMRVLSQAITSYNYFNLNVMACHCASLLLERMDYASVMLRPDQTTRTCYGAIYGGGGHSTAADLVVPIAFEGVVLMLTALPSMRGDMQVMMLLLHRCTHLLSWAQGLGLRLLSEEEAAGFSEAVLDLPVHPHPDVCSWGTTLLGLLQALEGGE